MAATAIDDLKDFVLPSLTSPERWLAVTAAWRKGSLLSKWSPTSYSSLKQQDDLLLQALNSYATATGRIDGALDSLAKMPRDSGDLDSRARQFVGYETRLAIGYRDACRTLYQVEQAVNALQKAAGGPHKDVRAALQALGAKITAARSEIEQLALTGHEQGLIPLRLSSRLDAVVLPARKKQVAGSVALTDTP